MQIVQTREEFLKALSVYMIPNYSTWAELGVLNGDFSKMILDFIKPKRLVLIDPFENSEEKYSSGLPVAYSSSVDFDNIVKRFTLEIMNGTVCVFKKYSHELAPLFEDKYFDAVYHDAVHLYEHIKRDLNEWLPKIKDDGLILGHDYADIADFGVIKAVDEFCEENNFEILLLNTNGGDFALRKKA